jgi:hypothetical protein
MLHFAKEEELYLPLLDRELPEDAAGSLVAEMRERSEVA